ncbi:hypothetical protein GHT09_018508 [Marmota monax]|uniref:Uncharacterized protein n=1 Tax=Marmota monax TaxID=9995 RepID=A0A834Q2S8_MARMO|nr:hypothetical protein GHT09_018508 [Marmota monax]
MDQMTATRGSEILTMGNLIEEQMGALWPVVTTFVTCEIYFKIKCFKGDSYFTGCFLVSHATFKHLQDVRFLKRWISLSLGLMSSTRTLQGRNTQVSFCRNSCQNQLGKTGQLGDIICV